MKEQEAIERHINECRNRVDNIRYFVKNNEDADKEGCNENISILEYAINALEEIQKYRSIGTIEELSKGRKYIELAKRHGTVGEVIDRCAEYEEIGTPDECRAAVEKQMAKKPKKTESAGYRYTDTYRCPNCGGNFSGTGIANYCYRCGQKLDWSEEE